MPLGDRLTGWQCNECVMVYSVHRRQETPPAPAQVVTSLTPQTRPQLGGVARRGQGARLTRPASAAAPLTTTDTGGCRSFGHPAPTHLRRPSHHPYHMLTPDPTHRLITTSCCPAQHLAGVDHGQWRITPPHMFFVYASSIHWHCGAWPKPEPPASPCPCGWWMVHHLSCWRVALAGRSITIVTGCPVKLFPLAWLFALLSASTHAYFKS